MQYYSEVLSADRLRRCYALAPPRVQQYLAAEIRYVLDRIQPGQRVLELGCGYGRVLEQLAPHAGLVVGIDTSRDSLRLARRLLRGLPQCWLLAMNAAALAFRAGVFDVTVCIQNGISAFHVGQRALIEESVRVTRPGGRVLFSSYAESFWEARLEWFRRQADAGMLGEIDWAATGDGVIVCKDGFKATTVSPEAFADLTVGLGASRRIEEVDASSVFCELTV